MKTIDKLQDFRGTLYELDTIIQELIRDNGGYSVVYFDAGYNNVDVIIEENENRT